MKNKKRNQIKSKWMAINYAQASLTNEFKRSCAYHSAFIFLHDHREGKKKADLPRGGFGD